METEEYYTVKLHNYELHITPDMLSVKGPLAIIWENKGQTRIISKLRVINARDMLEDMSKHKGPDMNDPRITFFWDDANFDVISRR